MNRCATRIGLSKTQNPKNFELSFMNINLPKAPRGVPNVTEAEDVLMVICQKAGLDPNKVKLSIVGGDRRSFFTQQGVKLMSVATNAMGVPVYLGCKKDTVEGNLHYEGINATELHSKLMGAFGNKKVHVVDDGRIRSARQWEKERANPTHPQNSPPSPPQKSETDPASPTVVTSPAPPPPAPDHTRNGIPVSGPAAPEKTESPETTKVPPLLLKEEKGSLAHNTRNLHLALVSLASRFKENQPFTFAQLGEVIENDVGIHNDAGAKVHVRAFVEPGYIVRLNPNRLPARYSITALCAEIAGKEKDEDALRLILESQELAHELKAREEESEEEPPPPPKSFVQQAQELRASEEEFQKLLRDTETKASELQKLTARKFDEEERDARGQIANLEKRLGELRAGLEEIGTARKRVVDLAQEVSEMRKRTTEGPLARAHLEFQELKKAMGS